jgi:hypothetical protein
MRFKKQFCSLTIVKGWFRVELIYSNNETPQVCNKDTMIPHSQPILINANVATLGALIEEQLAAYLYRAMLLTKTEHQRHSKIFPTQQNKVWAICKSIHMVIPSNQI